MNLRYIKTKWFITAVIAIASLSTWLSSIGCPGMIVKCASPSVLVALLLYFFDKWLWRWRPFSFVMNVSDISGHYEGEITFVIQGEHRAKKCQLDVKQSASKVSVQTRFIGDGSGEPSTASHSLIAAIRKREGDEQEQLVFFYENQGSQQKGDDLGQHFGTNVLNVNVGENGSIALDGYYFTNRKPTQTMGKMTVTRKAAKE